MSGPATFASPEDAEHAFYDAITERDADRLMLVWAEDEETVCVHPTGVRLLGLPPIRESWRSIFSNARLRVQPEPVAHWHSSVIAIHHLTEVLCVPTTIRHFCTIWRPHVYVRCARGWPVVLLCAPCRLPVMSSCARPA